MISFWSRCKSAENYSRTWGNNAWKAICGR